MDLLNKKEAESEQRRLLEAMADLKNRILELRDFSDALYELRSDVAVKAIQRVDELVSRFSHSPTAFPRAIKQFWSEEEILQATKPLDEALAAAAKADDGSMAAALGISASLLHATFLSNAMLTSLSGPSVRTVLGALSASTTTFGISSGAAAGLAGVLGTGLASRAIIAPASAIPVLGQILAVGMLAWSAWDLYDTAKTNAAVAEAAASARLKVEKTSQALRTQNVYLLRLVDSTEALLKGMAVDLEWFHGQEPLGTDYRTLSSEVKDRMVSLINKVMTISQLLTKTADDALTEAQVQAAKRSAA